MAQPPLERKANGINWLVRTEMAMKTISLLTYNIHKGFSFANIKFVLPGIKKSLENINPDIMCLQEAQGEHLEYQKNIQDWPHEHQHDYIAKPNWPHTIYGKNASYKQGHHGNAILSKLDIASWENIDVSNQKFSSRSVLHAVISIPNTTKTLHVMCIHFGLLKSERNKQLKMLCERIQVHVPDDEPLIIAGDFNDWLKSADKELQEILHLKEVFKTENDKYAKSFPVWQPMLSVDRIYYRGLKPVNFSCLTGSPWSTLSDHAPLYTEFEIEEK